VSVALGIQNAILPQMYISKHVKLSYQNLMKLELSRQVFGKNTQVPNFIKIRPVEAEFFSCGRTDRTDMMMLQVAFHNFANAPKNEAGCTCMSVGTHRVLRHYHSPRGGPRLYLCSSGNFTYRYSLFVPTTTNTTTTTAAAAATVTTTKLQVATSRKRVWRSGYESRQGQNICLFSKTSRPAMGPTRTPSQGVLLAL
jgi:hypothetical protein